MATKLYSLSSLGRLQIEKISDFTEELYNSCVELEFLGEN